VVSIFGMVFGVISAIQNNTVTLMDLKDFTTVKIFKVPNEIIDNIAEGEIVTFNVYINSYANNGQAYLSLTFKDLLQGVAT
jgi:predicted RecA/RadA family phage recombinase